MSAIGEILDRLLLAELGQMDVATDAARRLGSAEYHREQHEHRE